MKKQTRFVGTALAVVLTWLGSAAMAPAQIVEGFNDVNALFSAGWFRQNNSTPIGTNPVQPFQGNDTVFPAQAGPATSYAGFNFAAVAGANTISAWMLTPEIPLDNGTIIDFWTRTVTASNFPDRLQVRLGVSGSSTNVGTSATDVGDFGNLLLDINPTYQLTGSPGSFPDVWTNFNIVLSGLGGPTTGRVAFRYFVEDGGPLGDNSDFIGVDTLTITPVPEPGSMALVGLGLAGAYWRRRRPAKA